MLLNRESRGCWESRDYREGGALLEIRGRHFCVGNFCFGTFNRKEAEGELAFESGISGMSGVSGLSGRWTHQI